MNSLTNAKILPDLLWWQQTSGPSELIAQLTDTAIQTRAVSFSHAHPLPWERTLHVLIEDELRIRSSGMLMLEHWSPVSGAESADSQLVARFYEQDWNTSSVYYLPSMNAAKFLIQNHILDGRAVWIKTDDPVSAASLLAAAADFRKFASEDSGLLLLELTGAAAQQRDSATIPADQLIGEYDLFCFSNQLASHAALSSFRKRYASSLAIELSFGSAEHCTALLDGGMAFLREPEEYTAERIGSERADQFGHAVWKAQLNLLFSGIEDARLHLIRQNEQQLFQIIPFRDEFDNQVTRPEEFELRHLIFLQRIHKISLPSNAVSTLELLHDARNALAHLHTLSFEEVEAVSKLL
ncbi:MAG: hypothetical protein ACI4PQ_02575 [Butyricicoccaceae bacterium]